MHPSMIAATTILNNKTKYNTMKKQQFFNVELGNATDKYFKLGLYGYVVEILFGMDGILLSLALQECC